MTTAQTGEPARRPLRLWPGVLLAVFLVLIRFVVPFFIPSAFLIGMIGGMVSAVAIVVWWLFFSRAPWVERLGAVAAAIGAVYAVRPLLHESIATGMMGMMFFIYAIPPILTPALVAWAVATRHLSGGLRAASMIVTLLLACGVWTLMRTDGIMGSGSQLQWRWTPTSEERLLAQGDDNPKPLSPVSTPDAPPQPPTATRTEETPAAPAPTATIEPAAPTAVHPAAPVPSIVAEWPGFRGADRDGVVHGVQIETDWSTSPPVQLWRRAIGPGWSSFAVRGDLLYTQEQRGDDEVVASYKVSTGEPVWRHRDAVRFWESNGGAGPRATPTVSNGRVYTFGATGILNVLDAESGTVVWSRNVATDSKTSVPTWGFSSSPLVVGDLVIVAADSKLAAYDNTTGEPRWLRDSRGFSYSSPHLMTIEKVPQVLFMSGTGTMSVAPADGAVLWEHAWSGGAIVQPARISDGDVLITTMGATGGAGLRRLGLARGPGGWGVKERWTSNGLKPYFNDFVVHKGHAFGFDGSILACIGLEDGNRKWKGGRYGNGQLVLLPDQDLLLVLSEEGELALVSATPDQFKELARFPAIEGKTWNHPVLIRDLLLIRNGEQMAAFRLNTSRTAQDSGRK